MPIFLSYTNTFPYSVITDLRINDEMDVSLTHGTNVEEIITPIYIIATKELFPNLEIKVENENSSGASLYISPVDSIGVPTHWGKLITLTNIDATISDVKILINYKWSVINNIYILKKLNVSGNINIYAV